MLKVIGGFRDLTGAAMLAAAHLRRIEAEPTWSEERHARFKSSGPYELKSCAGDLLHTFRCVSYLPALKHVSAGLK